jgi:hypothetical protein
MTHTEYMGQENVRKDTWTVVEQRIRRIRTNQEFRGLYKNLDVAALTRTEWNGLDM